MKTELVFILDRSGSMSSLAADTIGGFNSLLEKQKGEPGEAAVTTVLFDDGYELLHDRTDIQAVRPLTSREYYVRGCTALLDAVGRTIQRVAAAQKNAAPPQRAEKVLFVIITDGMENASREYTAAQVRAMVERERDGHGWEFLFLGANIDAIAAARQFGIRADRAVDYRPDAAGTRLNYETVCQAASCIRANRPLTASWKAGIERDFIRRRR